MVTATTDICFEHDVLKADGLVLVDFWAEWCAPCKAMAPLLDAAAQSYRGKVTIVKLDVGLYPNTAARYRVRGLPALLLFRHGVVVAQKTGAVSRAQLLDFLAAHES